MKLLLVVENWISFYNQAESLSVGFRKLGVEHETVTVPDFLEHTEEIIKRVQPTIVFGVGSWFSWHAFVTVPREKGLNILPWIVSDGGITRKEAVDLFNTIDTVVTPSEFCLNRFTESGLKREILHLIPEAVDDDFWKPMVPDERTKKTLSVNYSLPLPLKYDMGRILDRKGKRIK